MQCSDIRDQLLRGQADSPAVIEHLSACEVCAELASANLAEGLGAGPGGEGAGIDGMWVAIDGLTARERGPLAWFRSRSTRTRVALALGVVAAIAGVIFIASRRADWSVYPALRQVSELVASALIIGVAAVLVLRPLHAPPARSWKWWTAIAVALGLPLLIAALPQAHAAHSASIVGGGSELIPRAASCFVYGSSVAAVAIAALLVLSRMAPAGSRSWVAVAVTSGVVGVLALELHCPITLRPHLVLGHAALPVVLAAVGFSIAMLRSRAASLR